MSVPHGRVGYASWPMLSFSCGPDTEHTHRATCEPQFTSPHAQRQRSASTHRRLPSIHSTTCHPTSFATLQPPSSTRLHALQLTSPSPVGPVRGRCRIAAWPQGAPCHHRPGGRHWGAGQRPPSFPGRGGGAGATRTRTSSQSPAAEKQGGRGEEGVDGSMGSGGSEGG